jgi:membrane fusion protein
MPETKVSPLIPQLFPFRTEVLESRRQRQLGGVILLQPVSVKILSWALAVAIGLIISFLVLAQYARKETVVGYLVPSKGVVKVFVPRPGIISVVHVDESRTVAEGDPLLTVTVDQITLDGGNVDAVMLDSLIRQKEYLIEQIAAQEGRTVSERARLKALIAGITDEITQIEAQIVVQRERSQLTESLANSVEGLRSQGFMTETEFKRRREAHLEQKQQVSALGQQVAARNNELTETRYALEQLPVTMAERVQTLRNQLSDVEQRIAEINGRRAYVVRAPVAGHVTTLQAMVGRTADPKQLQMVILPSSGVLQAELLVPTRAIGFVRPEQVVRVLYDAFPYQRFGTYGGRIVKVAQTVITGADFAGPVVPQEPAYQVTVRLDRQDVTAYGRPVPLQADMLLKADIVLDQRPLMAWLLDPLLSARL